MGHIWPISFTSNFNPSFQETENMCSNNNPDFIIKFNLIGNIDLKITLPELPKFRTSTFIWSWYSYIGQQFSLYLMWKIPQLSWTYFQIFKFVHFFFLTSYACQTPWRMIPRRNGNCEVEYRVVVTKENLKGCDTYSGSNTQTLRGQHCFFLQGSRVAF